jgi:hypothetical protein
MQQVQKLLIASVLGFGLAACSSLPVKQVEVSTKPIEKPQLQLPQAGQVFSRPVEWYIVTENQAINTFVELEKSGRPLVLFALSDKGYENLGLNMSDLRAFIQQQQTIIQAYENYYKREQKNEPIQQ